jgi:Hydrogenase maturation factor
MNRERLKVIVRGAVQGVGFRPFVYRLASELKLKGWVSNSSQGVFAELEGPRTALDAFSIRLRKEKPPLAIIQSLESSFLDAIGYSGFDIRESETAGDKSALILPDIATCVIASARFSIQRTAVFAIRLPTAQIAALDFQS